MMFSVLEFRAQTSGVLGWPDCRRAAFTAL